MPITVAAAKICRLFKKGLLCFPHFFCGLKLASTVKKIEEPKFIAALQQVGPFLFCTSASLASVSRNFLHAISGPAVLSVPQHGEQFNFFSVNKIAYLFLYQVKNLASACVYKNMYFSTYFNELFLSVPQHGQQFNFFSPPTVPFFIAPTVAL